MPWFFFSSWMCCRVVFVCGPTPSLVCSSISSRQLSTLMRLCLARSCRSAARRFSWLGVGVPFAKNIWTTKVHAGEGRRLAPGERLLEAELLDVEFDGGWNVTDRQAGVDLLTFDERQGWATHNICSLLPRDPGRRTFLRRPSRPVDPLAFRSNLTVDHPSHWRSLTPTGR